jgi:hypothetical protein
LAGWDWLDQAEAAADQPDDLARSAASCLQSAHGQHLLRHLTRSFLDRRVPPTASDAELRHAEGQRSVVGHLIRLVERGRQAPVPHLTQVPETGVSS